MEKTTFSSFFYVAPSKLRKNGTAPINMTITLNGERASFSTHKFVKPTDWDSARQRVKGNNETAKLINEYLDKVKEKLYRTEMELLDRGYILTAEVLRDAYLGKIDKLQKKTLFSVYEEFLADLKPAIDYIINFTAPTYEDLMYQLPDKQSQVLKAISADGNAKQVMSGDFAKRHGLVSASSVSSAVKALLDKDLITNDKGIYQVYDRFFDIWIRMGEKV